MYYYTVYAKEEAEENEEQPFAAGVYYTLCILKSAEEAEENGEQPFAAAVGVKPARNSHL